MAGQVLGLFVYESKQVPISQNLTDGKSSVSRSYTDDVELQAAQECVHNSLYSKMLLHWTLQLKFFFIVTHNEILLLQIIKVHRHFALERVH